MLLAAACVIGAAWTYTSLLPMAFLESGYPIWVAKQAILSGCRFGDVLILGDSRPEAGIIPQQLPLSAANVTFGGTSPLETSFFAQRAMQCPKLPKLVIYSHSMAAFIQPGEGLWKNATRYGYLGFHQLRQAAAEADRLHDRALADVDTHDGLTGLVRDIVYAIHFPSVFMASLIEARGFSRYGHNKMLLLRTEATSGDVTYGDTDAGSHPGIDADIKSFAASPLEAARFAATMQLLRARGVPVLILPMPVSQSTYRAMPQAPRAAFEAFLADAENRYPSKLSAPPVIAAWPDAYFVDGSHLNEKGATIFTQRIAACLRDWQQAPDHIASCDLNWR